MKWNLIVGCCVLVPALARAEPASVTSRWLTLGVMSQPQRYDAARGMRGELDLVSVHRWTLGVAGSVATATIGVYGGVGAILETVDLKAIGYVARATRFERWELRGALGAGVIRTTASGDEVGGGMTRPIREERLFPTAEASLRATVPISPDIAVSLGPTVSYYDQWFHVGGNETHRLAELVVFGGLSYRL